MGQEIHYGSHQPIVEINDFALTWVPPHLRVDHALAAPSGLRGLAANDPHTAAIIHGLATAGVDSDTTSSSASRSAAFAPFAQCGRRDMLTHLVVSSPVVTVHIGATA